MDGRVFLLETVHRIMKHDLIFRVFKLTVSTVISKCGSLKQTGCSLCFCSFTSFLSSLSQRVAPPVGAAAHPPSLLPARRWRHQRQQLQSVRQPGSFRSPRRAHDLLTTCCTPDATQPGHVTAEPIRRLLGRHQNTQKNEKYLEI